MTDIYLTSTFSNEWNVAFNHKIGDALEQRGVTCYLAHRDTNQQGLAEEKFKHDIAAIDNASIILAVALNETPNWGAEIGYAHGLKMPVLALSDTTHAIPLICNGMVTEHLRVENLDNIEEYIVSLVQKIIAYRKN